MPRGWTVGLGAGVVFLAAACRESITAPGACPDYCPSTQIVVLDTVLTDAIRGDTSYRGYVKPYYASFLQVTSTGTGTGSRVILRFAALQSVFRGASDTLEIVSVDSFTVSFDVARRATLDSALVIDVYRLPRTIDSLSTWTDVSPYFDDSLLVGSGTVPDSVVSSGQVSVLLPGDAFPALEQDSMIAAVGIVLRSPEPAYVDIVSSDASTGAVIGRYVTVAVADSTETRTSQRVATFDAVVAPAEADPSSSALAIGGMPAARTILRMNLPTAVVDSSNVVRATLVLPLAAPIRGALGDTVVMRADALLADVGAKSPFAGSDPGDPRGIALLDAGKADTVELDITHMLRNWRANPSIPRSLLLRLTREGGSVAEVWLRSTRGGNAPSIHVTYVPLPPEER